MSSRIYGSRVNASDCSFITIAQLDYTTQKVHLLFFHLLLSINDSCLPPIVFTIIQVKPIYLIPLMIESKFISIDATISIILMADNIYYNISACLFER